MRSLRKGHQAGSIHRKSRNKEAFLDLGSRSALETPPRPEASLAPLSRSGILGNVRSKQDVEQDISPHMRAQVVFQDMSGATREWRGSYNEEDTEESIVRRAQSLSRIPGNWRRLSFWLDQEGIRTVSTNKRKGVRLQFRLDDETEVRESLVGEEETPHSLLARFGKKGNDFVVDANGRS
jgi:hypothetical protein